MIRALSPSTPAVRCATAYAQDRRSRIRRPERSRTRSEPAKSNGASASILVFALAACATPGGLRLDDHALVNNTDFVYTVAFSKDSQKFAYTHLGARTYLVGTWAVSPPRALTEQNVNPYEFDVESVDFSPDGSVVGTASRDGVARFFNADAPGARGVYASEEPLVAIAFHPSGRYVAVGSSKGLVTVFTWPELHFAFEQRAHEGEVRALAFAPDGTLFSGGWDKSIVAFDSAEEDAPANAARMHFDRKGTFSVIHGRLNEKAPAAFAFDERVPYLIVSSDVARAAGIDVPFLKDTATVATALGQQVAKVAHGATLSFKSLLVSDLDVLVCDACLPAEAQGVLGKAFSDKVDVAFDAAASEAVLTSKAGTAAPMVKTLALKPRHRFTFNWFVNDFSLDKGGKLLGVAFSEAKAERNRDIYEREKKGLIEPARDGDCGAIVDANTGAVLHKWNHHNGVVSTAGISPDGSLLATGGWDKLVYVSSATDRVPQKREYGWSVRRVRFSPDGHLLGVGAWTPQNPLGDQTSNPSAVIFDVHAK